MQFSFACATDVGRLRPNNEDAVVVDPAIGLAVLADGMGGYRGGEVASRLCCETVQAELHVRLRQPRAEPRAALLAAVAQANQRIYEASQREPAWRGMGTTVVAALMDGVHLTVAHVGDSRLYRLRQGSLVALTRDHSLVQEQVQAGLISAQDARATPYRNLLTRAIGVGPAVQIDHAEHVVEPGDTYLLCSDGLHDLLTDTEIARCLCSTAPLERAAWALIDAANAAGGRDNIAVALIACWPDDR